MTLIDDIVETSAENVRAQKECAEKGGHHKDDETTINGRPAWQCRCGYTGVKANWE